MTELDAASLAGLRQGIYRLLAAWFLYPEEERLDNLIEATLDVDEEDLVPYAFHGPWVRFTRRLQEGLNRAELEQEYLRISVVGPDAPCPLHEAFYTAPPGRPAVMRVVEVEKAYRELGLTLSRSYKDLPDHCSAQMEAMALLCEKEADAWSDGAFKDATRVLEGELGFLRQHLGKWFPALSIRMQRASPGTLYAAIAETADAFIKHDLDLLSVIAREVQA